MSQNNKEPTKPAYLQDATWSLLKAVAIYENEKKKVEELKEENKKLKEEREEFEDKWLKIMNTIMKIKVLKLQEWKDNQKEMCGMDSWSEDSDSEDEINSNTPEKID